MAASPNDCVPEFEVLPEDSFKCCNTAIKNMKLVVQVNDISQCLEVDSTVCIISVTPATPNVTIGQTVFEGDRPAGARLRATRSRSTSSMSATAR